MKIITKNHSLEKGVRGYLIYLTDENDNSLECFEVLGEEERNSKENELSEKYDLTDKDITFVSLEKFRSQNRNYTPLILVFYLERHVFANREMITSYGENVREYLESRGDDVRLFFIPTDGKEEIKCINPVYIDEVSDIDKLNDLISDLENKFQVGIG